MLLVLTGYFSFCIEMCIFIPSELCITSPCCKKASKQNLTCFDF